MMQPICKQLHLKPAVSTKLQNLILVLMLTLSILALPVRAAPQSPAGNDNKLFLSLVTAETDEPTTDTDEPATSTKATPILFKASLRKLPNEATREGPSPLCLGSACG